MDLITTLIKEKEELERRINAINTVLNIYKEKKSDQSNTSVINEKEDTPIPIDSNFPKKGTWLDQILYVIKTKDRFVHNNEIAEVLKPYYINKDTRTVKRRISSVLSQAKRQNLVPGLINYQFSKSKQDTVWGKQNWIDNEGKIKEEHFYVEKENNTPQNQIDF